VKIVNGGLIDVEQNHQLQLASRSTQVLGGCRRLGNDADQAQSNRSTQPHTQASLGTALKRLALMARRSVETKKPKLIKREAWLRIPGHHRAPRRRPAALFGPSSLIVEVAHQI